MSNVYTEITDQIVASLEAGVLPWSPTWRQGHGARRQGISVVPLVRPRNAVGRSYGGINVLRLWMVAQQNGYTSPYWMTAKKAADLGGRIAKRHRPTNVIGQFRIPGRRKEDADEFFARHYLVFNANQIRGLPSRFYPEGIKPKTIPLDETHVANPRVEKYFRHLRLNVRHGGNRAFYAQKGDYVQMPLFEDFYTANDYYCTKGHESIHWTIPAKRCNRDMGRKRFGDEGYAMEELVAEIGAAFWAADLGIASTKPRDDHAKYIGHWIKVLKNDNRAIYIAANHAQKAVAFLHARQPKPRKKRT